MNKFKNQLVRLQSLIECDRLNTGDDFAELVENDVGKLLKDYFDFRSPPKLLIEKMGDKLKIDLVLYAERIKNFNSVTKD